MEIQERRREVGDVLGRRGIPGPRSKDGPAAPPLPQRENQSRSATKAVEVSCGPWGNERESLRRNAARGLPDQLVEGRRAADLSRNTVRSYEQLVKLHILPYVGNVRLDGFSADEVERLYSTLKQAGRSAAMRAKVHAALRSALNNAKRRGLIVVSPLDTVNPPRHRTGPVSSLTVKQTVTFLESVAEHRLGALFVLAVTTGLRQGELFGLRWDDVDFEHRSVWVRHAVQEIDGELNIVEPKTQHSKREVRIAPFAVAALRRRKRLAKKEPHNSDFVFTSPRGDLLRKSNFLRRVYFPLRDAARLPKVIRFHDLRHTFASIHLQRGENPKVVQEALGHADVAFTLRTYSHVSPAVHRRAADALGSLLQGRKKGQSTRNGGAVALQERATASPKKESL